MPEVPQMQECAVCISPIRRHIDMMFLLGYKADEIVETLPEAPRYPLQVQAHLIAGHVDTDKAALTTTMITFLQDARSLKEKISKYMEDPKANNIDGSVRGFERFGYIHDNKLFSYHAKVMDLELRVVQVMAQMHGHLRAESHPVDPHGNVTNNTLNMVIAGDEGIAERVLRAAADKLGLEIKRRPAIEVEARKKKSNAA